MKSTLFELESEIARLKEENARLRETAASRQDGLNLYEARLSKLEVLARAAVETHGTSGCTGVADACGAIDALESAVRTSKG